MRDEGTGQPMQGMPLDTSSMMDLHMGVVYPGSPYRQWSENVRDPLGNMFRAPGETRRLLMTCPKCKRLVFELDETHRCPWCVSVEEEC
jgi:hypothetical protein